MGLLAARRRSADEIVHKPLFQQLQRPLASQQVLMILLISYQRTITSAAWSAISLDSEERSLPTPVSATEMIFAGPLWRPERPVVFPFLQGNMWSLSVLTLAYHLNQTYQRSIGR